TIARSGSWRAPGSPRAGRARRRAAPSARARGRGACRRRPVRPRPARPRRQRRPRRASRDRLQLVDQPATLVHLEVAWAGARSARDDRPWPRACELARPSGLALEAYAGRPLELGRGDLGEDGPEAHEAVRASVGAADEPLDPHELLELLPPVSTAPPRP